MEIMADSRPEVTDTGAGALSDDLAVMRRDGKLHVKVRELSRDESLALLAGHHVGHIALTFHDRVRLKLCNYLYSEGWIHARTELGEDLTMARHHPWGAFEVDETVGIYDWRSVEVSGAIEFLSSDMQSPDWYEFENSVNILRKAVPQILTADDPMPQRIQLVRLHVDNIQGRESSSVTTEPLPRA
jgi:nitroimidazol reductase NimA-like FMN-containing flavoprotein (pyridoxamine 5'-phosphate oxidase superfamily)